MQDIALTGRMPEMRSQEPEAEMHFCVFCILVPSVIERHVSWYPELPPVQCDWSPDLLRLRYCDSRFGHDLPCQEYLSGAFITLMWRFRIAKSYLISTCLEGRAARKVQLEVAMAMWHGIVVGISRIKSKCHSSPCLYQQTSVYIYIYIYL